MTVLLVTLALIGTSMATAIFIRGDRLTTDNSKARAAAVWTAVSGSENAKNWLVREDPNTGALSFLGFDAADNSWQYPFPAVDDTPVPFGSPVTQGEFTTRVHGWGDPLVSPPAPAHLDGKYDKFEIRTLARAPDNGRTDLTEIVQIAGLNADLGLINIKGGASHAKLGAGGNTSPIPFYTLDGRDFDRFGKRQVPPLECAAVVPVVGPIGQQSEQDTEREIDTLRRGIVNLANGSCNANGTSTQQNKPCTPGQWWVRGNSAPYRFITTTPCTPCDPADTTATGCCHTVLDLSRAELRADPSFGQVFPDCTANPTQCPLAPLRLGPIVAGVYDDIDQVALTEALTNILEFTHQAPNARKHCFTSHVHSDLTLGSWDEPVIAIAGDPQSRNDLFARISQGCSSPNSLEIKNATLTGTGILIVNRVLQLDRNARFHWRGILLILDNGKLEVKHSSACGAFYGAAIIEDSPTAGDWKIRLDNAGDTPCDNPFWDGVDPATEELTGVSFNHSCEAIHQSLGTTLRTIAWYEDFD